MKEFWLFRSDIRHLEYYHYFKDLETFEQSCHDHWVLFPLQMLKDNIFDQVVIWRLQPSGKKMKDIVFEVNGKKYIQRWVDNFNECTKYGKPWISFWRGGFKEYDDCVIQNPNSLGYLIYIATGERTQPRFGGKYDLYLMEGDEDIKAKNHIPFYKPASNKFFFPKVESLKYDLCWAANFTQIFKGQEFFIKQISKSNYLQSLKIVHCGNKPEIGIKMAKKYGVNNIEFKGSVPREILNNYFNQSRFGLLTTNHRDSGPRTAIECLAAGTPLLIRDKTRFLDWYCKYGAVKYTDDNLEEVFKHSFEFYSDIKSVLIHNIDKFSIKNMCKKNWDLWKKWVA